ncbi:MAG: protein-export chaperone SecB [Azospirillaceae bacterium]|nr:protein-export chaperone SecB [Azospirillaceae bacterium]
MSDQPTAGANGTGSEGSEAPLNLPITINAQYIKDLSFENPNAPRSLQAGQPTPRVSVSVDVDATGLAENLFEVVLSLTAKAAHDDTTVFIAELSYGAVVTLTEIPKEHVAPVLFIEVARLLFPFARQIISGVTSQGGFPPLLINPVDFADLFRRKADQAQETQGEA